MNFEEIKNQATAQWQAMRSSSNPRILIGTGTCGIAAGAEDILDTLRQELDKNLIRAEIIQVGCIGLCYAEPLIEIVKPGMPGVFYGNLTPELASEVIRDYLVSDNPRPDLALGSRGEGTLKGIPKLFDLPVHCCRRLQRFQNTTDGGEFTGNGCHLSGCPRPTVNDRYIERAFAVYSQVFHIYALIKTILYCYHAGCKSCGLALTHYSIV